MSDGTLARLERSAPFAIRHIGPRDADVDFMLTALGYSTLADLSDAAVPAAIRSLAALDLPAAASEAEVITELRAIAAANQPMTQMIGLGYADTVTPGVIRRNVLENPGWYTAYTPYQPEISQGRLEALLNFQTMVQDLTGLPTANASMLDEATAVAEAVALAHRVAKNDSAAVLVDADTLPQTVAVLRTRARPMGIEVRPHDLTQPLPDEPLFAVVLSYPGATGEVRDLRAVIEAAHDRGAQAIVTADPLALTLLASPAELGADIAVGVTQRFGVPLGFGGPHAGFLAVRAGLERQLPGRLVGVSVDADGRPAYRLALQTREQHIRREKATSNICTAQVLLAVMAGMYAVYHGPEGLRDIARRTHRMAAVLATGLRRAGLDVVSSSYFDTVRVRVPLAADGVVAAARDRGINVRRVDADTVAVATSETTTRGHVCAVWEAFGVEADVDEVDAATVDALPTELLRTSDYLMHPVFHSHRSETSMLRYLRALQDKDIALDRSMIPLGSCTIAQICATSASYTPWVDG